MLEGILAGTHKRGSIKLVLNKRGIWYACISVPWEVPKPAETTRFIGVDRGQNHLAVAVAPEGRSLFLSFRQVRHTRTIGKKRVAFALAHGCGIRMEDLSGIR